MYFILVHYQYIIYNQINIYWSCVPTDKMKKGQDKINLVTNGLGKIEVHRENEREI